MIDQWFGAMNDTLDDLICRYPHAADEQKKALEEQWNVLKSLSDGIIEAWLQFEDKMAVFRHLQQEEKAFAGYVPTDALMGPYMKGQGYFKLNMFQEGAKHFEETLLLEPELNVARLFLAMCRLHLSQFAEAQRHFQLIAALSEENKLRSIAYNALGCIQAVFANMAQARLFFQKAMEADPEFEDPRRNLESCRNRSGSQLQLNFGSSELQALVQAGSANASPPHVPHSVITDSK